MSARIAYENIHRFASKAPLLEISSSDPVDTTTGVAVNKTITLTFSTPLRRLRVIEERESYPSLPLSLKEFPIPVLHMQVKRSLTLMLTPEVELGVLQVN